MAEWWYFIAIHIKDLVVLVNEVNSLLINNVLLPSNLQDIRPFQQKWSIQKESYIFCVNLPILALHAQFWVALSKKIIAWLGGWSWLQFFIKIDLFLESKYNHYLICYFYKLIFSFFSKHNNNSTPW